MSRWWQLQTTRLRAYQALKEGGRDPAQQHRILQELHVMAASVPKPEGKQDMHQGYPQLRSGKASWITRVLSHPSNS